MTILHIILGIIYKILKNSYYKSLIVVNSNKYLNAKIDKTAILGDVIIKGNITIKKNSYMNSGQLITGDKSKIIIGYNCAIGYDVKIIAITHDKNNPTGKYKKIIEKNIRIGNNVWIGSNVFIREGIKIGSRVIIGAGSIVTKNIPSNSIAAGNPCRIIKKL